MAVVRLKRLEFPPTRMRVVFICNLAEADIKRANVCFRKRKISHQTWRLEITQEPTQSTRKLGKALNNHEYRVKSNYHKRDIYVTIQFSRRCCLEMETVIQRSCFFPSSIIIELLSGVFDAFLWCTLVERGNQI